MKREIIARWTAHTNDRYLTGMMMNRHEPCCIDLNARIPCYPRKEGRGESQRQGVLGAKLGLKTGVRK